MIVKGKGHDNTYFISRFQFIHPFLGDDESVALGDGRQHSRAVFIIVRSGKFTVGEGTQDQVGPVSFKCEALFDLGQGNTLVIPAASLHLGQQKA